MKTKEEVFVQNEEECTKALGGTSEYLDESIDSRRLSEKWDKLICQKLAEREERKKSLMKVAQTESILRRIKFCSFDSFGFSRDESGKEASKHVNQQSSQHRGSLSTRVRRTLKAFSSFGADRQDPEIAVAKDSQGSKSRHRRASKRPSIMDMIISFNNKSTNNEAGGAVKEAQNSSTSMQGRARKRVSFAKTVNSIKNKSTLKAPSKKDSSQNKDARAKESLSHGDTEAVNNFHNSNTVQGRAKKRGSLVKLVNSIKCMAAPDNKEKGGHKHQPCNQDSSRQSKPRRRRVTEGSLRCSAKKFTEIAMHGSLLTDKTNEKCMSSALSSDQSNGSQQCLNDVNKSCLKEGMKINLGGEDSYNEKISSILYTNSACYKPKGRRRHTK